jgi:hypothetical protein
MTPILTSDTDAYAGLAIRLCLLMTHYRNR